MVISAGTEMMLFRFSNYKRYKFIEEHEKIIKGKGYVWMLKNGKRSSIQKIKDVQDQGGWLILRSPKADGGVGFLAHFTEISENDPKDAVVPTYYSELLNDENLDMNYGGKHQWFKIDSIKHLNSEISENLILNTSGNRVADVIDTTRTAVMFVHNDKAIEI